MALFCKNIKLKVIQIVNNCYNNKKIKRVTYYRNLNYNLYKQSNLFYREFKTNNYLL